MGEAPPGRRDTVAERWQRALAETAFSPLAWQEVRERLLALTDRLIAVLAAEPFDPAPAREVGAALPDLHYVQPEVLAPTLAVLARELPAGLAAAEAARQRPRLAAALGELAAGFARRVRDATLEEQATVQTALLRQRRRAEEALRASEARFRAIYEEAAIGIGLADREGRIADCNAAWAAMLGFVPAELRGKRFTEIAPREDAGANWRLFAEMMGGRRPHFEAEQRFVHRDGEIVWCYLTVSLVRDAAGVPEFAAAMAENISERKRAEAASERQYRATEAARGETRAVLDATVEGIALVAPDRRFLTVNRRFTELFGVRPDEVVGRRFDELQVPVERAFADPAALRALVVDSASDRDRRFTQVVEQRWPERRDLELYSAPVAGAGGEPLGRLYAFRDVTRERAVDRMKSEFVALVSHELRTPLTSIKGYVDLLLDDAEGRLSAEQREFLGVVKHNADRLAALIADLLDLSHLESGRLALRPGPLDLGRIVAEVAASLRPQLRGKRQHLVVAVAPRLPVVWGDAERVVQILTNLVSNAHKYTPDGGEIVVAAAPEGAMVRVEVRDNGVGMTEEEQAHLFTRFYRARNPSASDAGGTGLGLAITRELVQLHGGTIGVDSAPGRGTTVALTLPAAAPP